MVERRDFVRGASVVTVGLLAGCSEGELAGTQTTEQEESEAMDTTESESDGESMTTTETDAATDTPTADGSEAIEVTFQNVGSTAWEVTSDESGSVAETGVDNPEVTFTVGERYLIRNGGWSAHPFALLADDNTALLSQDGGGTFQDDSAVDWVDDGGSFAFTVTQELADELSAYICTIHGLMRGDVTTQ